MSEPIPVLRIRVEEALALVELALANDDLERLFTPFERLGVERTEIEGTGLGLAVSKSLVEAMGGSIGARSEPGKGSTFVLELTLVGGSEDP